MPASRPPRLALNRATHKIDDRHEEATTRAHDLADLHHQLKPATTLGRGAPTQQRSTKRVPANRGAIRLLDPAARNASPLVRTAASSAETPRTESRTPPVVDAYRPPHDAVRHRRVWASRR